MKKFVSMALAAAMVTPMLTFGTVGAGAYYDDSKYIGGFGVLGEYRPSQPDKLKYQHLLFAMPNAWQNEVTQDSKCGGAPGIYWWAGIDRPDDVGGGHGWPGYKTKKETAESNVSNLFGISVPAYGNGENYNIGQIVWNNYLDGGTETDRTKNPFYNAAVQSNNCQAQLMSRWERNARFDYVFRYGYMKLFEKYYPDGREELDAIDMKTDNRTYWESMNRLAAKFNEEKWEYLDDDEKGIQVEFALDTMEEEEDFENTLKEIYGTKYAKNFFNEDSVELPQDSEYYGLSFTFDNMVYVVDFDVKKITKSELSGKLGFGGEFYFYYGDGEYGTWPTRELNEWMKIELGEESVASGNFTTGDYVTGKMPEIMSEDEEYHWGSTTPTSYTYPYTPVSSGKFYFDAASTNWDNYQYITCYIYEYYGNSLIPWGSKKGRMKNEGNGIWSFDLEAKGITIDDNCGVIFTADWGVQTCDLIIGPDAIGATAYCTGEELENNVDPNKKSEKVQWDNGAYGVPKCITSIGNVIGDVYWPGENGYSMFVKFLKSTGADGIDNAKKYTGKTDRQIIDDTSAALGLSEREVEAAIEESGRTFDWHKGSYNNLTWRELDNGTLEITGCTGNKEELVIPDTINGKTVARIGDWAFHNNKYLTAVTIPDTVTAIGKGAFYGCPRLTEIDVPDSVTRLGANAFEKCLYLESVSLSRNLTSLADETFFDCRRLRTINIPDKVKTIGDEVFFNCRSLKNLSLPNGVGAIGTGNAALGMGVFENCRSLERIVIPDSVTAIGENAFVGCEYVTLCGSKGSYAQQFAADTKAAFDNIGNVTSSAKIIGDANGDLNLTVTDATVMQQLLAEFGDGTLDMQSPEVIAYLDADGDGVINVTDITMIQRFLAEYIDTFR